MLPICLSTGISRRARLFARTVLARLTGIGYARAQSAVGTARVPVKIYSALASPAAMVVGPLAISERLTLTLTLAPSDARAAALQEFLNNVTTPGTADYHRWMTPSEFGARFGADAKQINSVMDWAEGAGPSVSSVSPALDCMMVSGFTLQMERVFAVLLHLYLWEGWPSMLRPASLPLNLVSLNYWDRSTDSTTIRVFLRWRQLASLRALRALRIWWTGMTQAFWKLSPDSAVQMLLLRWLPSIPRSSNKQLRRA